MTKPVVVNHFGRRDSYQLALAFAEVNLLEKLVTDFYIDLERPYTKPFRKSSFFNKRFQPGLPGNKVKSSTPALLNSLVNRVMNSSKMTRRGDIYLAMAAYDEAIKTEANLFLYSYTAYEAFEQAARSGPGMKKHLFQIHPSPDFIRNILVEEIERYPFAKDSIMMESEMKEDKEMERLRAEPLLADHIFVASGFTKKSLVSTGISGNKISVIPYGLDFASFPLRKEVESNSKFSILFIGQLVQRKGIVDLLMAIRKLSSSHIHLTICTRGHFDENIVKEFPTLDLRILRNPDHNELLKELHQADLFVFPSLAEGFGFVILEAMHCGVPVITTTHTCGADLIEDKKNGFLVPVKNPEILAATIEYCIQQPEEIKRIGLNGHSTARHYDWKKFRNGIIEQYRNLEHA